VYRSTASPTSPTVAGQGSIVTRTPWQCLGSAPARLLCLLRARLAALGGSRLLGERPGHWAPRHCRRCPSEPPPKPPVSPLLTIQAEAPASLGEGTGADFGAVGLQVCIAHGDDSRRRLLLCIIEGEPLCRDVEMSRKPAAQRLGFGNPPSSVDAPRQRQIELRASSGQPPASATASASLGQLAGHVLAGRPYRPCSPHNPNPKPNPNPTQTLTQTQTLTLTLTLIVGELGFELVACDVHIEGRAAPSAEAETLLGGKLQVREQLSVLQLVRARVRVRIGARVRIGVRVRTGVRVRFRFRFKFRVRVRVRASRLPPL
jgi:hypothetical protein